MDGNSIKFLGPKYYKLIRSIDRGGFGKTVLLKDELIDEYFVCKKYDPADESFKEEFFKNFIQEIKLLHLLFHKNIVRVFNYYLYPNAFTGYILMEYVHGTNIEVYAQNNPDRLNDLFTQTIEGFQNLEELNILHRDIRPQNILVSADGILKIIDFGFGKRIQFRDGIVDKSISLNWRYLPPSEFSNEIYDFRTEVYFIGKLFEELILKLSIENFLYSSILKSMVCFESNERASSFFDISRAILNNSAQEIQFNSLEKRTYLDFAENLLGIISSISNNCNYVTNTDQILSKLEHVYNVSMLEDLLQNNSLLTDCFIEGSYKYKTRPVIHMPIIKAFKEFFKGLSVDRRKIVLNNIWQRLDAIIRSDPMIDDLPF